MADDPGALFFEVFNEIGIIEQLSRTLLEARLPEGLIAPHFAVISHLVRRGDGRPPIEIARAFQVPKTSMTHTIKGLEGHGLVEVRPNPDDGRSKLVWLTPEGRSLRSDVVTTLAPDLHRLERGFDVTRLSAVLPVLRDLRIFLDDDRNHPVRHSGSY
ncbi:MarR family winged helix-turn-helix transcriptional regulator [Roseobacter ponti]|uniref:MarR family transcriptional regulator n=1 Tax=Roseobacter ponti TaxID=1891787 RepID=A0A858SXD8_9RHOB|nr:MarR family transcriptional regulator [Roseobacter ponti]QJF52111.1 MarR family transcriptional regulator [Roseobacter ponti]